MSAWKKGCTVAQSKRTLEGGGTLLRHSAADAAATANASDGSIRSWRRPVSPDQPAGAAAAASPPTVEPAARPVAEWRVAAAPRHGRAKSAPGPPPPPPDDDKFSIIFIIIFFSKKKRVLPDY